MKREFVPKCHEGKEKQLITIDNSTGSYQISSKRTEPEFVVTNELDVENETDYLKQMLWQWIKSCQVGKPTEELGVSGCLIANCIKQQEQYFGELAEDFRRKYEQIRRENGTRPREVRE